MPELPEVETVKRLLAPQIVGRHILEGIALHTQVIAHPGADAFFAMR